MSFTDFFLFTLTFCLSLIMVQKIHKATGSTRELLFQLGLHAVVFFFYAFDSDSPHQFDFRIESYRVAFFLNYMFANAIIGYFLLPMFLYKKKYVYFFGFVLLLIAVVIFIEEAFLENIYFPDSRGANFPGIFFSLGQILPIIAIFTGFKFAWDALTKQKQVEALEKMVLESELQFLKSQINPHFLFNNLNNLYSYAVEKSPKTPAIILELSSVLRYMLYECREKYVLLSKEIEQLENFTRLYELQIEERGVVNFSTSNIHGDFLVAPLILIVFIENAFKHSQAGQASGIAIDISIQLSGEGQLDFYCKNNFSPVTNTQNTAKGIGLENVKKRLQLIYPDAHHLEIRQNQFFEVKLTLNLKKSD
jgi:two-component system, LytTR family, sensor kinase